MTESMFVEINHHLSGHWKDELEYPREGLATLKKERKQLGITTGRRSSPSYQEVASPNLYSQIHIEHEPISFINPRTALKVRTKIFALREIESLHLRYRSVNQHLDYKSTTMKKVDSETYEVDISMKEIDPTYDLCIFWKCCLKMVQVSYTIT